MWRVHLYMGADVSDGAAEAVDVDVDVDVEVLVNVRSRCQSCGRYLSCRL